MRLNIVRVEAIVLAGLLGVACGGKVDDPTGRSSSGQQSAGSSGSGASSSSSSSSGSGSSSSSGTGECEPSQLGGGGAGVAGGACTSMFESAACGSTVYTVSCTCPNECECTVNGETVDTAPTTSCSETTCPPPDDAWKACGFPVVAGMP